MAGRPVLMVPLAVLIMGVRGDPPGATCGKPPPDPLPPCSSEWDCTLSGECVGGTCVCDLPWTGPTCATLALKPAPPVAAAPFVPPDYPVHSTWGCAPFFAPNSTPCFYYDNVIGNWTNKSQLAPPSDIVQGSLGLACAIGGDALGPYVLANASAVRWRAGEFDDEYLENSLMTRLRDGSWLLAYTTSPPGVPRDMHDWEGNGGTQYIGIARATSPLGPWERASATILEPDPAGFEQGIANNPAVLELPDGSLSATYRGRADDGFGNCLLREWNGTCTRPPANLFNDSRWQLTEDPFSYANPPTVLRRPGPGGSVASLSAAAGDLGPSRGGYIMISHCSGEGWTSGAGTKAISLDGVHWAWAGSVVYSYLQPLTNGTTVTYPRREEPKLLLAPNGLPTHLFNAVYDEWGGGFSRIIVAELDYASS